MPEGCTIRQVVSPTDVIQFGEVLSALFGDTQEAEQLRAYYGKAAARH
ncbi:hypothetical protein MH117_19665 [Paenibacillus sp. ACRRX]|nr:MULTISPECIES: hypothetical protein [unclassified Paenibacillus]MCG7409627.1 hypothetical protein [Paenibacillus sp. ACRRX]MDK8183296.1 hypothetical protein [Paenibacillus sp. UMB4589-SE434]